jgi:AraC-like DNA-binding protein
MAAAYVHAWRMRHPLGRRAQAHDHPFHELVLVVSGHLGVVLPAASAEAGPGELLWYPRGAWHLETVVGSGPCDWMWVNFTADGLPALPPRLADRRRAIGPLIGLLWERRAEAGPAVAAFRDHLCAAIAAELVAIAAPAAEPDPWLAGLEHWMRGHLAEPITLDGLARRAGLSRAHFARTWHARAGCPPMASLRRLRLAAARDLILGSDLPLSAVAPQTGFANEQVLSRLMRRHLGCGARALRRLR